jgi:arginine decarboxylase
MIESKDDGVFQKVKIGVQTEHMDHTQTPLYERMMQYHNRQATSFHVPGHKSGKGLDRQASDTLQAVMSIDLTEIPGLDDLHHPEGVIRDAEQLAADCFGADRTFLLVGGSTVGNLAMILSLCKHGQDDLFIVQRNVHKSIIHGLMLAGARAVFLTPRVDSATGIAAGVSSSDVEEALNQYPEAAGVLLTNPNYYGMGIDLRPIIDRVHAFNKPVFVDEAHGAHYGFHPDIPTSALSAGADGVVQSTHKMLTAMTMGAMLHLKGDRIDPFLVQRHLSIVQSSSPSYPILASLDISRRQIQQQGKQLLGQALQAVERLNRGMAQMPWFQLVGKESPNKAYDTQDPLKITIGDRTGTLNGFDLQKQLEMHNCYPEMADPYYVVLALSLVTQDQDVVHLLSALSRISVEFRLEKQELACAAKNISILGYPPISLPVLFSLYPDAAHGEESTLQRFKVPAEEAVGYVTDHAVIPYPPGIPLLYPGEQVSIAAAEQLRIWMDSGARIHGLSEDGKITIRNAPVPGLTK